MSLNEETTNRIFNRIVDILCGIKGFTFFSEEEYRRFDEKGKQIIKQEIEKHNVQQRPTRGN